MSKWIFAMTAASMTLMCLGSGAESLDAASEDALKKTLELLNSSSLRDNSIKDTNAKRADQAVNQMAGGDPNLKNDIYSLSSVVFERIARESQGNPAKMNEILLDAQRDPASFANKYFPAGTSEAAKLQELAERAKSREPVPALRP